MIDLKRIRASFDDFRKEESGSVAVELVFIVPGLTFIIFMTITFFAGFRAEAHATRAATVITDIFSRELAPVTPNLLDGIEGIMKTMVLYDENPDFRITSFTYNATDDEYIVAWSKDNGVLGTLDNQALNDISNRIPDLRDGQHALLVETSIEYDPIFDIGIGKRKFENFNVSAPRFLAQLCYMDDLNADPLTAVC